MPDITIGEELCDLTGGEGFDSSFTPPPPSPPGVEDQVVSDKTVPELAQEYAPNAFYTLIRDLDQPDYKCHQAAATKILNIAGYVEKKEVPGASMTVNINFSHIKSMAEALKGVSIERNVTGDASLSEPGSTPGAELPVHLLGTGEVGVRE